MINVSSGTATVLGLSEGLIDAPPTTAYLLVGRRCQRDCSFCTQARSSRAPAQALSRVIWPPFEERETISRVAEAYRRGMIRRVCLQVTVSPGYLSRTKELVACLKGIPTCASVVAKNLEGVERLLNAGLEVVGLSLDAANEAVYSQVKGGSFPQALAFIEEAAKRFPGHIATHLMVGLGETEEEISRLIQRLHDGGVIVALFAFTPTPGTALEDQSPPPLDGYRRVQIARHLIVQGLARAEDLTFSSGGKIGSFEPIPWREALKDGKAFQTSGCPDCNRPYYNERPGGPLYNYPRPLTPDEVEEAIEEARIGLTGDRK